MPRGQTITLDLYTQIPKTVQNCFSRVRHYKNNAEIFLRNKYENIGSNHKTDGRFFATHHTAQILHPRISTSLEPSKIPSVGKGLGVKTRLLKKLTIGCKYKIQTGNKRGSILRFLAGARLKVYGDFVEKICV
jgi:hypothetical protein